MRIEKRAGNDERLILAAMVTDPVVLSRLASQWGEAGLFGGPWANLIGGWCVKYHGKFGTPPGNRIRNRFETWASGPSVDEDQVKAIEKFLEFLSNEHENNKDQAPEYILDLASAHFNKVKLRALLRDLETDLENDDVEGALKTATTFGKVEFAAADGVDPFLDKALVDSFFAEQSETLIEYPGALGKFMGRVLCRDSFVSFLAPEKRGKTWWLLDMAYRGMCQRRRVAFFEIGDMSLNQINGRWWSRMARLPRWPVEVKYPLSISKIGKEDVEVEFAHKKYEKIFAHDTICEAMDNFRSNKLKTKDSLFKLSVHPAGTVSVATITGILDGWEMSGWVPDVVCIDYADLLEAPGGIRESRDQINSVWKALRGLSQKRHCLVATATQAKAQAYGVDLMGMEHFSEDKRKLAHVNAMVGINQTPAEKVLQVQRLNFIVNREEEFSPLHQVYVAGCLALGNPAMVSTFRENEKK